MKKVRFVFYRAKFDIINVIRRKRKLHLVDDGISWWTGIFNWGTPPYSHMSNWIQDEEGNWIVPHDSFTRLLEAVAGLDVANFAGTCYTSTMRKGKDGKKVNGTVSRPASEVFTDPGRWEYIKFEVTDESFERAKAWADERVRKNKGYGKKTILRFFLPLPVVMWLKLDDPERDICSEFGEGMATRLWNILPDEYLRMLRKILIRSPRRLWRDLVRRHHVPTYSLATDKMVRDEKGKKVKP